jgi:hypothetical protein
MVPVFVRMKNERLPPGVGVDSIRNVSLSFWWGFSKVFQFNPGKPAMASPFCRILISPFRLPRKSEVLSVRLLGYGDSQMEEKMSGLAQIRTSHSGTMRLYFPRDPHRHPPTSRWHARHGRV